MCTRKAYIDNQFLIYGDEPMRDFSDCSVSCVPAVRYHAGYPTQPDGEEHGSTMMGESGAFWLHPVKQCEMKILYQGWNWEC